MKPLLLVGLLAAHVSAATITTLVEVRSGDETCSATDFCEVFSEVSGYAAGWSFVGDGYLWVGAWVAGFFMESQIHARTFASVSDSYLPPANGTAVFGFDFYVGDDLTDGPRMEFNGSRIGPPHLGWGPDRFTVPVRAGVPFSYVIELTGIGLMLPEDGGGHPRGYDFIIFPHEIAFIHAPEPATAAPVLTALLAVLGWLAWRRKRERAHRNIERETMAACLDGRRRARKDGQIARELFNAAVAEDCARHLGTPGSPYVPSE